MAGGPDEEPELLSPSKIPMEDRPTLGDPVAEEPVQPHRPATRVGEVLDGRWRLLELLGSGGMSNVYRAEHVTEGRIVAVKLLLPELASSALYARRVLREGRAANAVSHPNVVRVEDIGMDANDAPYLVQEFLSGMDLWDYAATQRGIIPADQLIAWMVPVLDALATFHEAGIIHRDLKPANVFLVKEGDGWTPRLLDFGLASLTGFIELPRITASDVTLGTPAYMSPEQIRDPRSVTPRADLWSVGVMLYEMLTGVLPFQSDNVGTFVIAISSELPVPVRRRAPWLSSGLSNVVMQCLEKDPRHRPASARALITALTNIRATTAPPSLRPDSLPIEASPSQGPSDGPAAQEDAPSPLRFDDVTPPDPALFDPEAAAVAPAPLDPVPAPAPDVVRTPVREAAPAPAVEPVLDPPAVAPRASRWWMVTVAVVVLSLLAWAAAYGLPAE